MASLWLVVSSAGWSAGWNVGAACNWTKQQARAPHFISAFGPKVWGRWPVSNTQQPLAGCLTDASAPQTIERQKKKKKKDQSSKRFSGQRTRAMARCSRYFSSRHSRTCPPPCSHCHLYNKRCGGAGDVATIAESSPS